MVLIVSVPGHCFPFTNFKKDGPLLPKICIYHLSRVVRKTNVKTKTQIGFAVTAKPISAFVFAKRIVQSLYFLNPKFQASRHLL